MHARCSQTVGRFVCMLTKTNPAATLHNDCPLYTPTAWSYRLLAAAQSRKPTSALRRNTTAVFLRCSLSPAHGCHLVSGRSCWPPIKEGMQPPGPTTRGHAWAPWPSSIDASWLQSSASTIINGCFFICLFMFSSNKHELSNP